MKNRVHGYRMGRAGLCYRTSGVIRANGDDAQRVKQIGEAAYRMIVPGAIVLIETPPPITYGRSARGLKPLNAAAIQKNNWVVGALVAVAGFMECRVEMIDPLTWKGRRSKKLDQMITGKKSHDESDALSMLQWWVRVGVKMDG